MKRTVTYETHGHSVWFAGDWYAINEAATRAGCKSQRLPRKGITAVPLTYLDDMLAAFGSNVEVTEVLPGSAS